MSITNNLVLGGMYSALEHLPLRLQELSCGSPCKHMAILACDSYGYIVCHETIINRIYSKTKDNEKDFTYKVKPVLFNIFEQFRNNKNQKTGKEKFDSEVTLLLTAYESLFKLFAEHNLGSENEQKSNKGVRKAANEFYNLRIPYPENPFSGGNNNDVAVVAEISNEKYIIPENCLFYSCDVKYVSDYLCRKSFQFILMDPPWWNKFIRRKRKANAVSSYTMLYDEVLKNLPIDNLLDEEGLIGIWCTNSPSHIDAIFKELFPAWGIEFVSQWYWLKVTKQGKPICAFTLTLGKQPYERIIFGKKKDSVRKCQNPENNKVIMSVPSGIHSHKPPMCELMKPYLPENGDCLELFARYLLPHWTSYGNEVLKLQHSFLYNEDVYTVD